MNTKIKESKGLKTGSQTTGLNQVKDNPIYESTGREVQLVKIHTNRTGVLKLINTILRNNGETRQLSSKDNFERIGNMIEYINKNLIVNVQQLVDWDKCSDKNLLKHRIHVSSQKTSSFDYIRKLKKNDYYLQLSIYSYNTDLWEEIVKHYPGMEWIIDGMEEGDENSDNDFFWWSRIYRNDGKYIRYQLCNHDDIDTLEQVHPIHFGFMKNDILLNEIHNDINKYHNVNENEYPIEVKLSNEVVIISNPDELVELIKDKIRMWNINVLRWKGLLNGLYEDQSKIKNIDSFSPIYFDHLDRNVC